MYARKDIAALRQGDILRDVFFPVVDYNEILHLCKQCEVSEFSLERTNQGISRGLGNYRIGPAVVVSQCCELERRSNGKSKTSYIQLCPLQPWSPGQIKSLKNVRALEENRLDGYLSNYYFKIVESVDQRPLVTDFSMIFPVKQKNFDFLLQRKVAQMSGVERVKFKTKLAMYLGRPTDEEVLEGIYPHRPDA